MNLVSDWNSEEPSDDTSALITALDGFIEKNMTLAQCL